MTQPVKWPDGARCAIMMTFDLDGESPWIHRDPALAERPLHMSMGAYGPKTGMPRILELLDRYGIKTCFFIPGWIVERYPALCEDIVRRGHEVGHHGYLHEKPFFMKDREEEEELLVKSLEIFEKILGAKPLGARAPSAPERRGPVTGGGRLRGRVALVTGASRGFGRAIALAFAREGAQVAVNYLASGREADEVVADAGRLGTEAIAIQGDVARENDACSLVKSTLDRFGRLDILVNNAGIMVRGALLQVPADAYQRMF